MRGRLRKFIRAIIFSMPVIAILVTIFASRSDKYEPFINKNYLHSEKISALTVTFYALGDWGTASTHQKVVAQILRRDLQQLKNTHSIPFVLGLGDNVYPDGLPDKNFNDAQVSHMLNERFGQAYHNTKYAKQSVAFHVVPGNHDYHQTNGRLHEETTAEYLFDGKNDSPVFKSYPIHHGEIADSNDQEEHQALKKKNLQDIALPQSVVDTEQLLVIALDTPLYLKLYAQGKTAVIQQHWSYLRNKLQQSPAKWKLLFGHHPLKSHGSHGGFRSVREWTWTGTRDVIPYFLRPFTFLWLTSLSVVSDYSVHKIFPYKQDLNHPSYSSFAQDLHKIIHEYNIDFYVAGHDHNLQFIDLEKNSFQIISGSAGKLNSVSHGKDTIFAQEIPGFVRFDLQNTKMFVNFFAVDIENTTAKVTTFCIKKDQE